jgi:hypothetical protein
MPCAERLESRARDVTRKRLGIVVAAGFREDERERLLAVERVDVRRRERALPSDRLAERGFRRLELAACTLEFRAVVQRLRRDRVVAVDGDRELARRFVETSSLDERPADRVRDMAKRASVAAVRFVQFAHGLVQFERPRGLARRRVGVSERKPDLRLDGRIARPSAEFRLRLLEDQLEERRVEPLRDRRVDRREQPLVEHRDLAPARGVATCAHACGDDHAGRKPEGRRGRDRAADRHSVAPRELPQPVRRSCAAREDRLAREPALEVVGQFVRSQVAARRGPRERTLHDPVEVVLERAPQRAGRVRRQHVARSRDRTVDDLPLQFERSRHPGLVGRERPASDERLEEHHAERPDVDAAVDLGRARRDLGRHVERRRGSRTMHGRRAHRVVADDLRDAEIDHARLVEPPARRRAADEHVLRLQIPVQDALAMRVADGARDERKHADARLEIVAMTVAPEVERDPVDELHHEVRRTLAGRARVEDVRDVRMLEPRERDLLAFEPARGLRSERREPEDLHRHRTEHRIELLPLPDRAERTLAEHVVEPDPADAWRQGALRAVGAAEQEVCGVRLRAVGFHRRIQGVFRGSNSGGHPERPPEGDEDNLLRASGQPTCADGFRAKAWRSAAPTPA